MKSRILIVALAASLTGCTVGPDYTAPFSRRPCIFSRARAASSRLKRHRSPTLKWFEIFKDDKLQELIRTALQQNYDLRDAVARVEAARASLGITRSAQFPNFGASGAVEINRLSREGATPLPPQLLSSQNRNFGEATLSLLSFEIDIWGRLRRATEAARADLLSADENRKAVITTLVSDVATAYLSMRELDYELEISKRTLQTRQQSLDLTKSRQTGGVSTLLDLRQAEQLVDTAAQAIPGIQQQSNRQRIRSGFCWDKTPATSRGEISLPIRICLPKYPPVCLRNCWKGVPISARRSRT